MKKKHVERFTSQYLLPHLEGFRAGGNLLYQVPVGDILRAFLFDSSAFSKESFYPEVFVQPLYVPVDHVTLTAGERFLGSWEFAVGEEEKLKSRLLNEMRNFGLPFLRRHGSAEGLVRELRSSKGIALNPRLRQVLAYSLLILGQNDEGLDELDKLLAMLDLTPEGPPWHRSLHEEVGGLRELLMRAPADVVSTLRRWAAETRQKLALAE
ncbi:MAG TPA: hypothetical protein VFO39_07725 [Candidatus Sulfotelmatobacter sp.]|nr:hypothetical protein [Candidatus Sulfotelmatobacter sp.]